MDVRKAVFDAALGARVVRSTPLVYAAGADASLDRPAHVRAASGLVRVGGKLVAAQDDAAFLAVIDPVSRRVDAITLPVAPGGVRQFGDDRGNKALKMDLESAAVVPDLAGGEMLVAFGSASTDMRERIVLVRRIDSETPDVRVVHAPALYAALRAERAFAGSEMNVEGATFVGGAIRFFNRGNGAARDGLTPVNATCDIDWVALSAYLTDPSTEPAFQPRNVTQYDLGAIDGCPLTFTDGAAVGGSVLFAASAEDSPDAVLDGPVAGSALGVIAADGSVRIAVIAGPDGRPLAEKVEGICPDPADPTRLLAVIDRDDPNVPSELLEVELRGAWW